MKIRHDPTHECEYCGGEFECLDYPCQRPLLCDFCLTEDDLYTKALNEHLVWEEDEEDED